MESRAYQATPTPVLDLLPSLLTTKTNRPRYWAHMKCRGLVDELIDDDGQFLDVSADETVTLRPGPEEVANPEQESPG